MTSKNENNAKRTYGRFDHKGKGKRAASKLLRRAAKRALEKGH